MSREKASLELVKEAILISEDILKALQEGDSELAIEKSELRQQTLEKIPFKELQDELSEELNFAFNHLVTINEKLTAASEEVQDQLGNKLAKIRKGISGTSAYKSVEKQ